LKQVAREEELQTMNIKIMLWHILRVIQQKSLYLLLSVILSAGITYGICMYLPSTYRTTVLIEIHSINPLLASIIAASTSLGALIILMLCIERSQQIKHKAGMTSKETENLPAMPVQKVESITPVIPLKLPETPPPFTLRKETEQDPGIPAIQPRLSLPASNEGSSLFSFTAEAQEKSSDETTLVSQFQPLYHAPLQDREQLM
jgi:hypothetical protein